MLSPRVEKKGGMFGFDIKGFFTSSGSEEEPVKVDVKPIEVISDRSSSVPPTPPHELEWTSPRARDNIDRLRGPGKTTPGHAKHHHWNRVAPVPTLPEDIGVFPVQPPQAGVPLHPTAREMRYLKDSNRPGQGKFRI